MTANLAGYVLKKDSPSCGLERVRVHDDGRVTRTGRGLFAEALVSAMPNLPVEEEGRLNDPALRENFVERVFAYQRLRTLFGGRWTMRTLVVFHSMHKLQLLSHSRQGYAELGRLVAAGISDSRRDLSENASASVHDRPRASDHTGTARRRHDARRRSSQATDSDWRSRRVAGRDRRPSPMASSPHCPDHADPASRPSSRPRLSEGSDLLRAASPRRLANYVNPVWIRGSKVGKGVVRPVPLRSGLAAVGTSWTTCSGAYGPLLLS